MKILISGTEIAVKSCLPYEYANGKRELRITIPQSEIDYTALKEVLGANTGEIVLTKDDGTTQTFSGYTFLPEVTDKMLNEEAVFYVVIQCVAEAERRALEAKAEAAALRKTVTDQAATISGLIATIENLNQQLLVLQLAAADLYEKTLEAEETTEDDTTAPETVTESEQEE